MRWIDVFIDVPRSGAQRSAEFWSAALGSTIGPPWRGHPEFLTLWPRDGDPFVHVQTIGGAARVHFDVATDDVGAEVVRLIGLGARRVAIGDGWVVMASPGGMPFCVCGSSGTTRPQALAHGDGHRSRLVQICVDAPPRLHAAEWEFWSAASGWELRPASAPEFGGHLLSPPGGTIRFLLQRLDSHETAVRAHIDLGTDDIEAEVSRLVELGAARVEPGRGWFVMRDPVGTTFCVTGQPP